ncbi:dimethylarginine dimethylaminohydrolase family protein [Serpentinicella alkaliphila]|uniref:N-dimethylarginine dimethylaminohydrolase n=1 Tax=Serpentinicella alkaliphila TaxID=1734049 RepID=A0A4R2TWM3_9FIRM|nr:arginine deiminase family protein [Serpentinicella alkaliphila]QUH25934.1 hypothetical protein HZR23_09440 [Serpentinicella alkaliphila]TCQ02039.1 N-dimethylarginine dimethylaminohydrolase [Serpentinicella alkaliphila]
MVKIKPFIVNEYDPIEYCIMAYPNNLQITDQYINSVKSIDLKLALQQYENLVNTLKSHGVTIEFLNLTGEPSQVFTRDIGFVVEDVLFISKMTENIRKTETMNILDFSKRNNLNTYIMENEIEGGDVLVHKNHVIIGIGDRSTGRAVEELEAFMKNSNLNYEIVPLTFDKSKIHLDCVFNILDEETCIKSKGLYNPEAVLNKFSKVIEVPDNELDSLAPNIVCLGNKNILTSNERFAKILSEKGYNSIFIDFTEIIKAQGSIGCVILPLTRMSK